LAVEPGGKQQEAFMSEREPGTAFVDPAFSQDDRLPPAGQRIANRFPLLECRDRLHARFYESGAPRTNEKPFAIPAAVAACLLKGFRRCRSRRTSGSGCAPPTGRARPGAFR